MEGKTEKTLRLAVLDHAAVLFAFCLVAVVMTWPMAAHLSTKTAAVGAGDQLFYARMLRHFLAVLTGAHSGLFDIDYYWPHPNVLATTDAALGILYGALPFLLFTRDLMTLVNLGVLLTFGLTAHAVWLLACELSGSRSAALVAAVGFSFCAYRFHQLDHLNVLQMHWTVYALFALLKLAQHPTRLRAALFALATILYATASMNVALYASPLFAAAIGMTVLTTAKQNRRMLLLYLGAALFVAGLVSLPLYLPYLAARDAHELRWTPWYFEQYSGRIEQLRAVPAFNRVYGARFSQLLGPESITFVGFATLLSALCAVALSPLRFWRPDEKNMPVWIGVVVALFASFAFRSFFAQPGAAVVFLLIALALAVRLALSGEPHLRATAWVWLLVVVGAFCLLAAFGPIVRERTTTVAPEGLWVWLAKLPGFSSVRTPARMFFAAQLCASLLAAIGLRHLMTRFADRKRGYALTTLVLSVVVAESFAQPVPLKAVPSLADAPATHRWIASQPGKGGVVELPIYEPLERERMFHSLVHDRPILNGEAGFQLPLPKSLMHGALAQGQGAANLQRLRAAGLEFVIVDARVPGGAAGQYGRLVEAAGGQRVAQFPEGDVYRFEPVEAEKPAASNLTARVKIRGGVADIALTANAWVFDFDTRKLQLHMDDGRIKGTLWLSPPLFAPGQPVTQTVSLAASPAGDRYKLVADDGAVWAEGVVER